MENVQNIKIAIGKPNGSLELMSFIIDHYYMNEDGIETYSYVEPTAENIEEEILKASGEFVSWKIVEDDDLPSDRTYRNAWTLRDDVIALDDEKARDIALHNIRIERNLRLNHSDLYVLPDKWYSYTDELKTAWTEYREALRNFPKTVEDPFNPIWPEKP
jgi:hypothetical protein